ncbi:MAG: succinate--CoA ligase, partial [Sulfurimonas sp.]
NDDSISLSDLQRQAINKLFELGYEHGFYDEIIDVNDYGIPGEYCELRRG